MLKNDLRKLSVAFMSNAKWQKLFKVINRESMELGFCEWKLVDETNPIYGKLPILQNLGDDYVGDDGALNGPFEFKRIEWILIPSEHSYSPYKNAPKKFLRQNMDIVLEKSSSSGNFEFDVLDNGIKVYGYKP
jgi:hypothetical protein